MIRLAALLLSIVIPVIAFAQQDAGRKSVLQTEYEYYSQFNFTKAEQWDSLYNANHPGTATSKIKSRQSPEVQGICNMKKRVFGWQPFWVTPVNDHDYSTLTDLSYFGYDVNSSTGGYTSIHDWLTSPVVTKALNAGVRVNLCVILFNNHSTFLNSAASKQNLIDNVISLVKQRGAHGVNVDFEGMSPTHSSAFASFMIALSQQMHAAIPGSEVSIALPAGNWSGTYSVSMVPYVDLFLIMGYDFYWSTAPNAGPVAPKHSGGFWTNSDITNSITYYLKNGIPASKLCLGVPYYGYDWPTSSLSLNATTTGQAFSRRYTDAVQAAASYGRKWDNYSATPYFMYNNGGPRQCWYDDESSLAFKYEVVNSFGLAGIGIWALGYDDGSTKLWSLLKDKFSDCAPATPCTGTMTDFGGPGNYYNNENWTTTLAPASAGSVTLTFSSFNTESNYDFLYIYDGPSTASPLIGKYSGSVSPGTVTASSGKMTLKFTSDDATTFSGWNASWTCSIDQVAPTTLITTPAGWITQNFTASFTDADNSGGSGLNKSLYHVVDYDGTEWRANPARGFYRDNFDQSLHTDWSVNTGTWANTGGYLVQSDETSSNTNLSTYLTQNLSNSYLYNWKGTIEGTGTNRRAGLHFFCDNPAGSNRGNSYLIWFRPDQGIVELYKSVNDVLGSPVYSAPVAISAGTWYDYKISYDRVTGKIEVYVDDNLAGSWTDSSPLTNGTHMSFRSGNCIFSVNNFYVYRSRNSSVMVNVGPGGNSDIRFQNPSPGQSSGMIKSIATDYAGNFSTVASQSVNVDWTAPLDIVKVDDGNASDIDITGDASQLSANWSLSSDPHSDVVKYWYAIGTSPGSANITSWTDNGLSSAVTKTGLSLVAGVTYYFSIKAENGAGLQSVVIFSDGQKLQLTTTVQEEEMVQGVSVHPNPFSNHLTISYECTGSEKVTITLTDISGKVTLLLSDEVYPEGNHKLQIDQMVPAGVYFLKIKRGEGEMVRKIIAR